MTVCNGLMSTTPGQLIDTKLSFQMNHASICGTMKTAFLLDAMGERCRLPDCVIERHSVLTSRVMVWGVIFYHGRSNLLLIEGYLISNRYVREVLQLEVVPFLQGIPGAIFQQDKSCPHVVKTVRDFCFAQHLQLLPWSAYSPYLSPFGLAGISRFRSTSSSFKRRTFAAHASNMEFSSTTRHSKSV
ncbi:uncharacterized protein TNCV_1601751 [Trichonephila clavipes]|nr:uncharacterized protein TNCV_1601751 [Trichonephila clavipes]